MSVSAQECPNCGAPLTLHGTRCAFCQMPLTVSDQAVASAAQAPSTVDPDAPFSMEVTDVFSITNRGTIVTGQIATGSINIGDAVMVEGAHGTVAATCKAIEMFRKQLEVGVAGDKVGLLLDGVDKKTVTAGDWIRRR